MERTLVLVGLGGAAGALARYAIDLGAAGLSLPWATLAINLLGALAIGALVPWISSHPKAGVLRPALVAGVLGGFTTVSAFAGDTVLLIESGQIVPAIGYIAATLVGGLAAVALGESIARRAQP